jgi:uroporphyrinogen decarboxylase
MSYYSRLYWQYAVGGEYELLASALGHISRSLDWTVEMGVGRQRIAAGRTAAGLTGIGGVQGNLDPALLYAKHDVIAERTKEILKAAGPVGHVMNLGHGIEATTPEENAAFFIETVRNYRHADAVDA